MRMFGMPRLVAAVAMGIASEAQGDVDVARGGANCKCSGATRVGVCGMVRCRFCKRVSRWGMTRNGTARLAWRGGTRGGGMGRCVMTSKRFVTRVTVVVTVATTMMVSVCFLFFIAIIVHSQSIFGPSSA